MRGAPAFAGGRAGEDARRGGERAGRRDETYPVGGGLSAQRAPGIIISIVYFRIREVEIIYSYKNPKPESPEITCCCCCYCTWH